jgi:hypothetical protein
MAQEMAAIAQGKPGEARPGGKKNEPFTSAPGRECQIHEFGVKTLHALWYEVFVR